MVFLLFMLPFGKEGEKTFFVKKKQSTEKKSKKQENKHLNKCFEDKSKC